MYIYKYRISNNNNQGIKGPRNEGTEESRNGGAKEAMNQGNTESRYRRIKASKRQGAKRRTDTQTKKSRIFETWKPRNQ